MAFALRNWHWYSHIDAAGACSCPETAMHCSDQSLVWHQQSQLTSPLFASFTGGASRETLMSADCAMEADHEC